AATASVRIDANTSLPVIGVPHSVITGAATKSHSAIAGDVLARMDIVNAEEDFIAAGWCRPAEPSRDVDVRSHPGPGVRAHIQRVRGARERVRRADARILDRWHWPGGGRRSRVFERGAFCWLHDGEAQHVRRHRTLPEVHEAIAINVRGGTVRPR